MGRTLLLRFAATDALPGYTQERFSDGTASMNLLDLVVGPNRAGKSTFVELTLAPLLPGSVFVNADELARQQYPTTLPRMPTTRHAWPPTSGRS